VLHLPTVHLASTAMTITEAERATVQKAILADIYARYPSQAAALSQTFLDLTHASKWQHLSVLDTLPKDEASPSDHLGRALIIGLRPEARGLEAVWCCSISDMLTSETYVHRRRVTRTAAFAETVSHLIRFQHIFTFLETLSMSAQDGDREIPLLRTHFLIAVHSPDATVVYYNMARGLIKPVN
jgi:hypothetical protein